MGRTETGVGVRSRLRRIAAVLLVLVLGWLVGGWFLLVRPATDPPGPADAVLVLGPPDVDGRVLQGYALIDAGYAKTLVISVTSREQRAGKHACNGSLRPIEVICFIPSPATTQGEAREIGRLAAQRDWHRVLVVTSRYHVSRARMIIDRCLDAQILMISAPGRPSLARWAYEYAYQTGAYAKALLRRGC